MKSSMAKLRWLGPLYSSLALLLIMGCGTDHYEHNLLFSHVKLIKTSAFNTVTIGQTPLESNLNLPLGMPQGTNKATEVLISHQQYVLSWNLQNRIINWAAWRLEDGDLGSTGRGNNFKSDPDLVDLASSNSTIKPVVPADYTGSCFDRGHQTPSGDRTDNAADNTATFYMSNMIPQTAHLNRVIWEHLENYERGLVKGSTNKVMIMAGPIFEGQNNYIGPDNDIIVPVAEFKIIIPLKNNGSQVDSSQQIVAVIMPNTTSKGTSPITDHATLCSESHATALTTGTAAATDWTRYAATVKEIEQRTGLDFSALGI